MTIIPQPSSHILSMTVSTDCNFISLATATVDGELWHTVQCVPEVSAWVRAQSGQNKLWFQHIDNNWLMTTNIFDVHPTVYIVMALKWL